MTEERQPTRFTVFLCPECGERANGAMWGPECLRYDNHERSEQDAPRAVKCEPVDLVPEVDLDKAKAALREIANPDDFVADTDAQVLDICAWKARSALKALDGLREPR